jgi:hypothetical protein
LVGQTLKNNQEPSFIRLLKWYLLRLNKSSLKLKAPIAIGVKLRSQLETERANRERIGAKLSELKQNFGPVAILSKKLTPDAATILSQLARQAPKIYRNAGVMLRKF